MSKTDRNYRAHRDMMKCLVREFNFATGAYKGRYTKMTEQTLLHPTQAEFLHRLNLNVFNTEAYKKLPEYMRFSLFTAKDALLEAISTGFVDFYYDVNGVIDTFENHRQRFIDNGVTEYSRHFTNNNSGFYWKETKKRWFVSSIDSEWYTRGENNESNSQESIEQK